MKTGTSLIPAFSSLALALALVQPGLAQVTPTHAANSGSGLLGQTYSGLEFGYTHHTERLPDVLRRYGFVANRPLAEAPNVDGTFRYNYTRGTTLGPNGSQHDFAAVLTGYLTSGTAKPFINGGLGWGWAKAGGARRSSFMYQVGAGAELLLTPQISVAPFLQFQEGRRFHERAWSGGVRGTARMNPEWFTSLGLRLDDGHNVEYVLAVMRRL